MTGMFACGRKRKSESVDFEQSDVRFGAKQTFGIGSENFVNSLAM